MAIQIDFDDATAAWDEIQCRSCHCDPTIRLTDPMITDPGHLTYLKLMGVAFTLTDVLDLAEQDPCLSQYSVSQVHQTIHHCTKLADLDLVADRHLYFDQVENWAVTELRLLRARQPNQLANAKLELYSNPDLTQQYTVRMYDPTMLAYETARQRRAFKLGSYYKVQALHLYQSY